MRRYNFIGKCFFAVLFMVITAFTAKAQQTDALGTYTPYSLYGIGDIEKQGTSVNRGMGGIGVGVRDVRYINYLNPASITARDTLSFMFDFGGSQKNIFTTDGKANSAFNTARMQNIIFTAPIHNKTAFIVGVTPFSNIGYKFRTIETNKELVSKYGNIVYEKYGTGTINQLFVGGAFNLTKFLSLGAEMVYYFGALNRYSNVLFLTDASLRNINTGWDYDVKAMSGRFGAQLFFPLGKKVELAAGATYRMATKLKGEYTKYAYTGSSTNLDTNSFVKYNTLAMEIPSEIAMGFSVRSKDKWMFGFDYIKQDWKPGAVENMAIEGFRPSAANSFRLGVEFTPNMYDIRYYMKRVTYRFGAYYDQSYVNIGGNQVNAAGVTFGMSMPVFRWYNAISWSLDLGQRGAIENGMIRERYVQLNLNFNLHDLWFIKKKYQ